MILYSLMTTEGAVVGCAGSFTKGNEKLIGAIVSSAWEGYKKLGSKPFNSELECQALEFEEGWIVLAPAGKKYLMCAVARDGKAAPIGLMKKKVYFVMGIC